MADDLHALLKASGIARTMQAERRTDKWPRVCICGERHQLLFTTEGVRDGLVLAGQGAAVVRGSRAGPSGI